MKDSRCKATEPPPLRSSSEEPWSMEMFRVNTFIALAAAAALLTASASAESPRHRRRSPVVDLYSQERPPLTVTKRSYLDPGNVAPAGKAMPNYMAASTIFHLTQDRMFARSEFQNEVLPPPPYVPGRPSPVFEFATPGSPHGP
jgi:hypothetical protein